MKQLIQCMGMLMLLFGLSSRVSAQITLVKDGKATSRIVLVEKNEVNEQAATLLQDFVKRISQATLPIVADTKARSGDILIGGKQASAGEDGFLLKTTANEQLQISSGGDKGAIYGVVSLLEQYMGVSYFAKEAYTLTPMQTITLPAIHREETPAFRYRQTYSYNNDDPVYKLWFRSVSYTHLTLPKNQKTCLSKTCGYTRSTVFCRPTGLARNIPNITHSSTVSIVRDTTASGV